MHIYIAGIGGSGLAPLAHLALDLGITVSGSDIVASETLTELSNRQAKISTVQDGQFIEQIHSEDFIDWFIYTSAIKTKTHPEYQFVEQWNQDHPENQIRISKRSGFINFLLQKYNLKLIAVAGTHGKTTTTAMIVWLFQNLGIPVSYLVGADLTFGRAAKYEKNSQYFVYECDEFDRNFLDFYSNYTVLTSLDYDHPDIYPTVTDYLQAFTQFLEQTKELVLAWEPDLAKLKLVNFNRLLSIDLDKHLAQIDQLQLVGSQNRRNGYLALKLVEQLGLGELDKLTNLLETFPGTKRRFEKLADFVFTDYAHHPTEIAATIQMAQEFKARKGLTEAKIVVVYQPHQNTRQHQIYKDYKHCFDGVDYLFWVPTYLTRENPNLKILQPTDLIAQVNSDNKQIVPAKLNAELTNQLKEFQLNSDIILFLGAGDIDAYARQFVLDFT